MVENRYLPVRQIFYFFIKRKGNKRKKLERLELANIYLSRPSVNIIGDYLVINNHLGEHEHIKSIERALMEEAKKLYPEFKDNIKIINET